jgi:hypothetical protein
MIVRRHPRPAPAASSSSLRSSFRVVAAIRADHGLALPTRKAPLAAAAGLAIVVLAAPTAAQNIDVSTLPPRESVQLTIYNSEDLTLVRETRHVTVRAGMNALQFSWANTLIDPTSVQLRIPAQAAGLELVDTVYPHDRPQQLS